MEKPSRIMDAPRLGTRNEMGIPWENSYYHGYLRKEKHKGRKMVVLSITANDQTARHDWRDFQQLKNLLVGEEWVGLEIYPEESNLKDPSNRFYIWCFEKGFVTFGLPKGRHVLDSDKAIAPQRPFPAGFLEHENCISSDVEGD